MFFRQENKTQNIKISNEEPRSKGQGIRSIGQQSVELDFLLNASSRLGLGGVTKQYIFPTIIRRQII